MLVYCAVIVLLIVLKCCIVLYCCHSALLLHVTYDQEGLFWCYLV